MPVLLSNPQICGFDDIQFVAIGITAVDHSQRHVGVFHRNPEDNSLRFLELAWHFDVRNDAPKDFYGWIEPSINRFRARSVAAFCRSVAKQAAKGIPYAFSPPVGCFDPTGDYQKGADQQGLTCATFVAGIFYEVGTPLIRYETWPTDRPADKEWIALVIERLSRRATAEHVGILRSQKDGFARVRPEEIAAAGAAQSLPASFEEVADQAEQVVEELHTSMLFYCDNP